MFGRYVSYGPWNEYYPAIPRIIGKSKPDGGKTLIAVICVGSACILIGMALGLGLGIGTVGLLSANNLTYVTNSTVG